MTKLVNWIEFLLYLGKTRKRHRLVTKRERMVWVQQIETGINRWRRHRKQAALTERSNKRWIAKMTNWQRNQWARAGYPQDKVLAFATMARRV